MILCCGESLIDMLPRASEMGQMLLPMPGGAVFNTAVALGRLQASVGYFGGLSTDLFGVQLAEALEAAQVSLALAPRSARPTTLAFVSLEDGQARYTFYDENTAGRSLDQADLPALPDDVAALFFGGISLVSEPAADAYATLCTSAAGRFVMIDPNIRPAFVQDETAYRSRLTQMLAGCDLLKVSDEDLFWLTGSSDPSGLLQHAGPAAIIVTRGAEGATLFDGTGSAELPAVQADVVDTVGAGDTFNAGVLAALQAKDALRRTALTRETLLAAMALGAQAAAVTVSRAGANPPWRSELP